MANLIFESHFMRKGTFDDDYFFYDDGTIVRKYDNSRSFGDFNLEETVTANSIPDHTKQRIMKDCTEELKETISKMLELY